jgi:hypothetical protein
MDEIRVVAPLIAYLCRRSSKRRSLRTRAVRLRRGRTEGLRSVLYRHSLPTKPTTKHGDAPNKEVMKTTTKGALIARTPALLIYIAQEFLTNLWRAEFFAALSGVNALGRLAMPSVKRRLHFRCAELRDAAAGGWHLKYWRSPAHRLRLCASAHFYSRVDSRSFRCRVRSCCGAACTGYLVSHSWNSSW